MLSEKKMKKDKEIVLELETQIKGTRRRRIAIFVFLRSLS